MSDSITINATNDTITVTDETVSILSVGVQGPAGGTAQNADEVPYVNTTSGLTATDVQAAIDEVEARLDLAEVINIVDDTTPQLGGELDLNGNLIKEATSNTDIVLKTTYASGDAPGLKLQTDVSGTPSDLLRIFYNATSGNLEFNSSYNFEFNNAITAASLNIDSVTADTFFANTSITFPQGGLTSAVVSHEGTQNGLLNIANNLQTGVAYVDTVSFDKTGYTLGPSISGAGGDINIALNQVAGNDVVLLSPAAAANTTAKIKNVADPSDAQDVATKNYVDTQGFITDITGENFTDLSDVTIASPSDGDILKYSIGSGTWSNVAETPAAVTTSYQFFRADNLIAESPDTASDQLNLIGGTGITTTADGADNITIDTTAILNVVEDTTPQLGGNLDSNGYGYDNAQYIDFNTAAGYTVSQGQMAWNEDEETLDVGLNGAVLQMGQEVHYHVRNNTASPISDGVAVMATGTIGASGRITIDEYNNDGSIQPEYFLGITTESIANGTDGKVTHFGKVRGINTTGTPVSETWNDGDLIYLSTTTPGALTNVQPSAPAHKLPVAIVIHAATNGTLFVRSDVNQGLEDLHDTEISTVTDKDYVSYNNANSRWENKQLEVADDTTPQLGGNLDVNGNEITSNTNGDVIINPNGTGITQLQSPVTYEDGYKDLIAPFNAAKLGGVNDPTFKSFQGGLYAYAFSATVEEEVFLVFHFDHDIKEGSTFYPHIHWAPEDTNTGTVRWGFEYSIARGHSQDAFPAPTTIYCEQAATGTAYQHQICEHPTGITFANLEPDTVIIARVFRDAAHVNDTYTGEAFGFMCDMHYIANREVTKNRAPSFN